MNDEEMKMRISESCAACLYDKQKNKTSDPAYLARVREIIETRRETDSSPYLVWQFNRLHEELFGKGADYRDLKKAYNDLVLSMEDALAREIEAADDPLAKAFVMARIGNYIDFGAMNHVDEGTFLRLFEDTEMREADKEVYASFLVECAKARNFLLICDNCGEIVLDRLFIRELKKRFPRLTVSAMVRGGEVLNDATGEDASYVGLDREAAIVSNGEAVAGTIYGMLPEAARKVLDEADVILAKGQGNYESMSGQGRHVFYAFLCKCDLFTGRFRVPRLTGVFVEEKGA